MNKERHVAKLLEIVVTSRKIVGNCREFSLSHPFPPSPFDLRRENTPKTWNVNQVTSCPSIETLCHMKQQSSGLP